MSGERQSADSEMAELSRDKRAEERLSEERKWVIVLAVGLIVQIGAVFFWGGRISNSVAQIEAVNVEQAAEIAALQAATAIDRSTAARLDERLNALAQGQARIEVLLDRLYRSQNGGSSQ
jgi:cell division protein FtsB